MVVVVAAVVVVVLIRPNHRPKRIKSGLNRVVIVLVVVVVVVVVGVVLCLSGFPAHVQISRRNPSECRVDIAIHSTGYCVTPF